MKKQNTKQVKQIYYWTHLEDFFVQIEYLNSNGKMSGEVFKASPEKLKELETKHNIKAKKV